MKTRNLSFLTILIFIFLLACSSSDEPMENPEPEIPIGTFIEGEPFTDLEFRTDFETNRFSIGAPIPSPNGQWLAYWHANDTASGMYLRNLQTSEDILLVSGGNIIDPSFDRTSQWLVYSNNGTIEKIRVDGSQRTVLHNDASCFFPTWNPVNDTILFTQTFNTDNTQAGEWIMDENGENRIRIGSYGDGIAWFPDGQTILSVEGKRYDLEGNLIQDFGGLMSRPKVSPDGQRIAWTASEGIYTMSTSDDYSERRLILPTFDPRDTTIERNIQVTLPFWIDDKRIIYLHGLTEEVEDVPDTGMFIIPKVKGVVQIYVINVDEALVKSNLPIPN